MVLALPERLRKAIYDQLSGGRRWASPLDLAVAFDPRIKRTPALELINAALVQAYDTPDARLAVSIPPQEGKTTLAVLNFIVWVLQQSPDLPVVLGTYNQSLANRGGRLIRNTIEAHPELGIRIALDNGARHEWSIAGHDGGLVAAGRGVGISGRPAGLIVVDDPFKEGEAQSETIRDDAWDWWAEGLSARLAPGASVIVIHCIVASMRVLMGDGGWRRIDEIRPGDRVVALDGSGVKLATARVVAQKMSGVDPTITVKTDRLSLTTNGRHPYAVLRRTARRPRAQDIEWVRADELKVGDLVVTAKSLPSDFVADDTLPDGTSVDESRAWLLGYMLGDGWVTRHVRRNQAGNPASYAVCIARSKSPKEHKRDLDERVIAALGDWCPNRIYSTNYGYFRADWNAGGRLLLDLGYGAGAHGKRVPACVWRWSPELRRAFIKGYAEADGSLQHVNASRNSGAETWRVGSVSYDLLDDVRMLALTCGIRPTTVYRGKATTYQPPNSPKPITSAIHTLGLAFLEDAEEGRSLLSEYRHPNPAELRYEKVRSIHHGDAQPVYDITVEGVGNFVAEGYVVHNTRWHADDMIGRLLERDAHAGWTYLNIPAQCEDPVADPLGRRQVGEFMVSARGRSQRQWESRKLTAGSRVWNALYQGHPSPAEGGIFKREWWQQYDTPQWLIRDDGSYWATGFDEVLISADLTFKGTDHSDYVAVGVWARRNAEAWLLDQICDRWDFVTTLKRFEALCAKWPQATLKLVEDKANGPALISMLGKRIPGIVPVTPEGGKEVRANAWAPLVEAGNVWIPSSRLAPWASDYIEQHAGFPNAAHDDMVDQSSQAVDRLILRPLLDHTRTVDSFADYFDNNQIINY